MAKFSPEKALQGSLAFAAQGADIGRRLKKKYGKKGIAAGATIGAIVGGYTAGKSGVPDPNLGANIYENAYENTRQGVMADARRTSRAVEADLENLYARRGLEGQLPAGVVAGNKGRVYAEANRALVPFRSQIEMLSARDRLEAERVGEYEKRQGWLDLLGSVGVTASNIAGDVNRQFMSDQKRILPEMYDTWTPEQQREFLENKLGLNLPSDWGTMTPDQQMWHMRNIYGMVPFGETPPTDYYGPARGKSPFDDEGEMTVNELRAEAVKAGGLPPEDAYQMPPSQEYAPSAENNYQIVPDVYAGTGAGIGDGYIGPSHADMSIASKSPKTPMPDFEGVTPRGKGFSVPRATTEKWKNWLLENDGPFWRKRYEQQIEEGIIPRNETFDGFMNQRGSEIAAGHFLKSIREKMGGFKPPPTPEQIAHEQRIIENIRNRQRQEAQGAGIGPKFVEPTPVIRETYAPDGRRISHNTNHKIEIEGPEFIARSGDERTGHTAGPRVNFSGKDWENNSDDIVRQGLAGLFHSAGIDIAGLPSKEETFPDWTPEQIAALPDKTRSIPPQLSGGVESGRMLNKEEIMQRMENNPELRKQLEDFYNRNNMEPGEYNFLDGGTTPRRAYEYGAGGKPPPMPMESKQTPPPGAVPSYQRDVQSPDTQQKITEAEKQPLTEAELNSMMQQFPMATQEIFQGAKPLSHMATQGDAYKTIFEAIELLGDAEAAKFFRRYNTA